MSPRSASFLFPVVVVALAIAFPQSVIADEYSVQKLSDEQSASTTSALRFTARSRPSKEF